MQSDDFGGFRDLFAGKRIYWQCFYGGSCVGLDRLLPIEAVNCMDEGSDFDPIADETGIRFCTVERPGERRINWFGCGIEIVVERCREAMGRELRRAPRGDWLITSNPASERLEGYCQENGYECVGNPARVAARFKHKRRLQEALRDLDLPRREGSWTRLSERRMPELQSEFGGRFVAQKALGAAGAGTFLIDGQAGWDAAVRAAGDESVYAAPHLGELSLNINAAVIGGIPCVGFPNVQLSGVERLETPWGGYCGNDYTAAGALDQSIIRDAQEQTGRLGDWLAGQAFEGLYGLDFVICEDDGRAYAVDLNPRWQGSTVLSIQGEMAKGRLPLAAVEFAHRCGVLDEEEVRRRGEGFALPVEGAHMCLRAPLRAGFTMMDAVLPGVYEGTGGGRFRAGAVRLADCAKSEDWLLTGGVPRQGSFVEAGALLARVCTRAAVTGASSAELNGWAAGVAAAVYRAFDPESP